MELFRRKNHKTLEELEGFVQKEMADNGQMHTDGNTLVQKRGCVLNHKLIYTTHFIEGIGAVKVVWLEATTQNSIFF